MTDYIDMLIICDACIAYHGDDRDCANCKTLDDYYAGVIGGESEL